MEYPKPVINFFSENIPFTLKGKRKLRSWIFSAIANEEKIPGLINIIFCDDKFLLPINKNYLHHDTLTDIITFNFSEEDDKIYGDIYISIERARENARLFKVSFSDELHRLLIHGILHLAGYDDKSPEEKDTMSKKEDYYLSLLAG
ncbi:MAG: rRNA maturation RNase YbeY [Bacteroidetes bacterium]|nr:rRNA maturation RNase YbeY [Bacteroidota bacterium]